MWAVADEHPEELTVKIPATDNGDSPILRVGYGLHSG